MMHPIHGKIPIVTLFENLSTETDRLAGVAAGLDAMMATLAVSPSEVTSDQLRGLQDVDALRQALEAISQITRSAANGLPDGANVDFSRSELAAGVRIQQVRDACLGTALQQDRSHEDLPASSAEPVFFDEV